MNRLIGIAKDKEISGVDCAMEEEVEGFEEGTTKGPELEPMRPFLNSPQHTSWNDVLCEMFVEHFEEEQDSELTQEDKETIEDMFHNRLKQLARKWMESHRFSPEELREREIKSNQRARRNTRRVDVSLLWIPDI